MFVTFVALSALLFVASAKTIRRGEPLGWRERALSEHEQLTDDSLVEFRLALHQRNLDVLAEETLQRADPNDAMYGKWLSHTQVLDLVAPDDKEVQLVVDWARANGLQADGSRRDVVLVQGLRSKVESVLSARVREWEHEESGTVRIGALEYSLPDDVAERVELLIGLQEFWVPPKGAKTAPIGEAPVGKDGFKNSVQAGYVIPDTVRRLYDVPKDDPNDVSRKSSICAAEFQNTASYSPRDLNYFTQQTGEYKVHVDKIIGPFVAASSMEPQLDIDYASTIAQNSTYFYWTARQWMMEFANDLFAYGDKGPKVVSMSWGWPEPQQCQIAQCNGIASSAYVRRVDAEWNKITATGATLVASSGDQGAPGDTYAGDCSAVSDIYPGGSPWVLSVGATMLSDTAPKVPFPPGYLPPTVCTEKPCSKVLHEVACSIPEALITSGGGFSSYEPMPQWQKKAVHAYLNDPNVVFPPKSMFNSRNRAFPDVAAIGHAILIGINQQMIQVDGTSCSAPEVGAMIALINGARADKGKSMMGFINPFVYDVFDKDPAAFKDITQGNNKCSEGCCSQTGAGYEATKGYDAVTGLGAFVFPKIMQHAMALP